MKENSERKAPRSLLELLSMPRFSPRMIRRATFQKLLLVDDDGDDDEFDVDHDGGVVVVVDAIND